MDVQEDFIPTKGSIQRGIVSTVETYSFSSHKSKGKKNKNKINTALNPTSNDDFNIKQAKREVIKFGMSGLDSRKKEEYKIQLAIKLGAKPPKNKYKNYAILQQEKKKLAKSKPVLQHLGKVTLQKSNVKRRNDHHQKNKKVKKNSIIENYGKVIKEAK